MPFLVHEGVCSTEAGEGEVKCSASLASMSGLRLRTWLWPPETTSALRHFLVTLEREWIKTGNRLVEMSNQCCCPSLKPAVHPGWNISNPTHGRLLQLLDPSRYYVLWFWFPLCPQNFLVSVSTECANCKYRRSRVVPFGLLKNNVHQSFSLVNFILLEMALLIASLELLFIFQMLCFLWSVF